MKTRIKRRLSTCLALAATVGLCAGAAMAQAADLPDRTDYDFGFAVAVQDASEFFAITIPLEVYQSASDPKLRDTGVYNADDQPVPRRFEHPRADDTTIERTLELSPVPFFGLEADQPDQLRLLLHTDENGITLDMDVGEIEKQKAKALDGKIPPTSYIIDFRKLEHTVKALEFEWPAMPEGFMGTVYLEDSVDLQYWRKVGSATLAELRHEDALIEQSRIKLNKTITDYLRISWKEMPENWRLTDVTGVYNEQGIAAEREWLNLDAIAPNRDGNEFFFNVGGHPPVDKLSVMLPSDNVVVRASVYLKADGSENWRQVHSGVFYNVSREGKRFETPPVSIGRSRSSLWKVVIDSGTTNGPVRLKLGWRPDNLMFVAQGTPPFELRTGRPAAAQQGFPEEKTLGDEAIFAVLKAAGTPGTGALGPREQTVREERMDLGSLADWKKILLWLGLIAAVLVVGKMTLSLLADLKKM